MGSGTRSILDWRGAPADSPMADHPVLAVERLTVTYAAEGGRVRAVDDVSFAIQRGEVLGLVGESGSGKSTVAAAVIGLLAANARVESGRVLIEGENLGALSAEAFRRLRGNRLTMVFQDPLSSLTPSIRVGEQIAEVLRVHRGLRPDAAERRTIELLASVEVPDPALRARAYPHQLSGGMQQRVLIAMALACDPDVLIMDEPTTALDVTTEATILDLVADLKRRVRAGILYITHDMGVVARLCDRVAVLYAGQLLEEGTAEEIFHRPRHPYTKGLLASIPRLDRAYTGKRLPSIPGSIPSPGALPPGCVFGPRCPFAAGGCAERVQPRREPLWVRCERAQSLTEVGWPDAVPEAADAGMKGAAPGGDPLVRVKGLSKEFQQGGGWEGWRLDRGGVLGLRLHQAHRIVRAVDGVSLDLRHGETLALVGESGCGKTTLGRMIVRLIDPTAGSVVFDGTDLAVLRGRALRRRRREFQIVFQNPDSSLNPRRRVGETLARPLIVFGLAERARLGPAIGALLRMVQLPEEYAERYPHELSGGEKQRVAIARALATRPRVAVLDEPVTALDVSVRASVLNLLVALQAEIGLPYLLIAHDLAVVRQVADRVAVMYRGRLCEVGPADVVFAPPFHPYTRALLSAIPIPEPAAARRAERIRLTEMGSPATTGHGCPFSGRCPVRIGPICDEVTPRVHVLDRGHTIVCHHELATLGGDTR